MRKEQSGAGLSKDRHYVCYYQISHFRNLSVYNSFMECAVSIIHETSVENSFLNDGFVSGPALRLLKGVPVALSLHIVALLGSSTERDDLDDNSFWIILWPCHSFQPRRPGFEPRSGHVASVVDKVALGQVFSEYFGFLYQSSFHRLLHTYRLSFGAGTMGQVVADVPSGLSLTPPQGAKEKYGLYSGESVSNLG
jgi:hypothetical protein